MRHLQPQHAGLFAYAAIICKNLAESISILIRYERLIDDANDARMVNLGDKVALQWIPRIENPNPLLMQVAVASWANSSRSYTNCDELIYDAEFACAEPDDVAVYKEHFGGSIKFDCKVSQIIFPADYLDYPIPYHDSESHQILL